MPTPRETILAALHARLSALPATALRGEVLPERVPNDGLLILRDGDQMLVTQAINGDPCELEFAYVLPSGESFTFTVHAVYLPRPRIEISGPQGVQATFDWQAARDSVVGRMCTATLINDIEVY